MALTAAQTRWLNRALPVVRWAVALLLVIWLARVVADTALLWLAGPAETPEPDDALPRLQAEGAAEGVSLDAARVAEWDLFGEYEPDEPEEVAIVDAPDTTLQLELLGLFRHSDPERARAIIADRGGDAELYTPGDSLPGGATLEQIHVDRVILRHRGELEALRFETPELEGSVEAGPRRRAAADDNGDRVDGPGDEELADELSGDVREQRETIIRELSLQPVEEGETSGYRITDQAPRELLGQVGLRPGDLILSVNGHELGEEDSDVAALEEVMQAGSGTIEVQRGSRTFTVSYPP